MPEPTIYEKDTRMLVDKLEKRLNGNLERIWKKLDEIQEKLVNRLPVWATIIISVLVGIVGALLASLFQLATQ